MSPAHAAALAAGVVADPWFLGVHAIAKTPAITLAPNNSNANS